MHQRLPKSVHACLHYSSPMNYLSEPYLTEKKPLMTKIELAVELGLPPPLVSSPSPFVAAKEKFIELNKNFLLQETFLCVDHHFHDSL